MLFKIFSIRLEKEGCSVVSGLSFLFVSVFGIAFTGPALLKIKELDSWIDFALLCGVGALDLQLFFLENSSF